MPARSIAAYLRAKDLSRPHLLDQAFTEQACLRMEVRTATIAFPPLTQGREAIGEVLVRRFNETYENIYSVCLGEPPVAGAAAHRCNWLVVMSEKSSREPRVGCGRYDWAFEPGSGLVSELGITIVCMLQLPPTTLGPLMAWASALPAPWCDSARALRQVPPLAALQPWREAMAQLCGAAAPVSGSRP
ncbi:MAG TPA: hypothetical protein VLJ58_07325 [Ramlibacter sp.]|nr:hypothetical protein [Ramlibacter sp.]